MRKNEIIALSVAGVVLVLTFIILQLSNLLDLTTNKLGATQAVEIVISFLLVVITAFYVKRTAEIADATRKQAEASVKMAEEMSKPSILPDFSEVGHPGQIWFRNLGNGHAFRLEFKFAYSPPDIVKRAWIEGTGQYGSLLGGPCLNLLKAGDRFILRPELAERSPGNKGTAFVEYSDIYGRRFLSGWGYRCERESTGNLILEPTEPIYPLVKERGGRND